MPDCANCGAAAGLPYLCNYCDLPYCSEHRLPENHQCLGLEMDPSISGDSSSRYSLSVIFIAVILLMFGGVYGLTQIQPTAQPVLTKDAAPTVTPLNESSVSTSTSTPDRRIRASNVEKLIHQYVNAERSAHGLSILSYDDSLGEIAGYHSRDMAQNGYFAHDSPAGEEMSDRYDQFGYDCRVSAGENRYYTGAENIAYTYYQERIVGGVYHETPDELAKGIVNQWMDSPRHRENILREEWRSEGIGVAISQTSEGTKVIVTQNFC